MSRVFTPFHGRPQGTYCIWCVQTVHWQVSIDFRLIFSLNYLFVEKKCVEIPWGLLTTSDWLYCPNALCPCSDRQCCGIIHTHTYKSLSLPLPLCPSLMLFSTVSKDSDSFLYVIKRPDQFQAKSVSPMLSHSVKHLSIYICMHTKL